MGNKDHNISRGYSVSGCRLDSSGSRLGSISSSCVDSNKISSSKQLVIPPAASQQTISYANITWLLQVLVYFCDATVQIAPRPPHCWRFYITHNIHTHIHTHTHTHGMNPLHEWSARRRSRYLHNTRDEWPGRGSNPRSQQITSLHLRLRPHSQRGRQSVYYCE